MGGCCSDLKLFDLRGHLHHTVNITCLGVFLCMFNKHVVYSGIKAVRMIYSTAAVVTMFSVKTTSRKWSDTAVLVPCSRKSSTTFANYITENVNGDITVTDWKKNAVIAVDRLGTFRFSFPGKDSLFDVCSVATDSLGHVIVTDYARDRIHMLNKDRRYLRIIIPGGGIKRPRCVCILAYGEMMVGKGITGLAKRIKYLED